MQPQGDAAAAALNTPADAEDSRGRLAVVGGGLAPYRIFFHRRLVNEVPELRLVTFNTRPAGTEPWGIREAPEINAVQLDPHEKTAKNFFVRMARQWRVGGRLIRYFKTHRMAAALINGYAHLGHVRLWRYCRKHHIPVLICADSNIRSETTSPRLRPLKKLLLPQFIKRCDVAVAYGSLGRDYFLRYGARPDRIVYAPTEPDYVAFSSLTPEFIAATMARYGLMPERKRIVFCARLIDVKRADLAIDAFANIAPRRPDWDLVIVGEGPLRDWLHMRVPSELRARVIWTGFVNDQRAVSAIYANSHVLVLSSDYEPWAMVISEAVVAGMAVIASAAAGATPELVVDGVNGRVFNPGDREGLTNALLEVTDPDKLAAMRAAGAGVLADWRRRTDQVVGIREALRLTGVLKGSGAR